jgi:hypothetical protein
MIWNPVKTHALGYWTGLSESIEKREREDPGLLPNVRTGSEIVIASDYAGEKLAYQAISFILLNLPGNEEWDRSREKVRKDYLPDDRREMAYSDLDHDTVSSRALLPFLDAADRINGLLITFLLNHSIGNVIVENQRAATEKYLPELAHWKDPAFEKMFSVASLLGVLVAGLSAEGQNIWWLTDRDEIVANDQRILAAKKIFGAISGGYLPHKLGELRCGTEVFDQGTGHVKDLVSLTDLASGAFAAMWDMNSNDGALPTGSQFVGGSTRIPPKARVIIGWFARGDKPLKKLVCVFNPSPDGIRTNLNYYWPGFDVKWPAKQ